MRYSVVAALVLLSLTAATDMLAQEQLVGLKRGKQVRVYAPAIYNERFVGELAELTDETLEVLPSGQPNVRRRIAIAEVERLEISRDRWPVAAGLVIGTMAGVVASIPVAKQCEDGPLFPGDDYSAGQCAIMVPFLFGLAGGALGAGIGWLMAGDKWEEVSPDQLRVQPVATSDGFGLATSVRF